MFVPKHYRLAGIVIIHLFSFGAFSQNSNDYPTIFGEKYSEALTYIQKNQWISDSIARHGVEPHLAISIIFPELIRYSALRDILETHSLEVLYVQYGDKYADFSIGRFQIKPSFAYRLERDWNIHLTRLKSTGKQFASFDTTNNPKNRALRIDRLKDEQWQVKYLIMFVKMNEQQQEIKIKDSEHHLVFLASAYNVGYWYNAVEILLKGKKNYYHTSLLKPDICYNYADISLDYYLKQMPK